MNLIAPFARSMFIRNHGILMRQGAEGLARLLDAPLVSQENIDLMVETAPSMAAHGQIDPEPKAPRKRSF
jgi:hypothetical protein